MSSVHSLSVDVSLSESSVHILLVLYRDVCVVRHVVVSGDRGALMMQAIWIRQLYIYIDRENDVIALCSGAWTRWHSSGYSMGVFVSVGALHCFYGAVTCFLLVHCTVAVGVQISCTILQVNTYTNMTYLMSKVHNWLSEVSNANRKSRMKYKLK